MKANPGSQTARQEDLVDQLGQIARTLASVRSRAEAEPPSLQIVDALRELDRAALALSDAINGARGRLGLPPAPKRAAPAPAGAAKPAATSAKSSRPAPAPQRNCCPYCGAPVKPKNLARHIAKMHQAQGQSARPAAGPAPRPAPARLAPSAPLSATRGGSSPGLKLPGPTHRPAPRPAEQPRMEELADSETLRKITLELELLNRDLYRDR